MQFWLLNTLILNILQLKLEKSSRNGRCFFRASSNTIKSKLQVLKHIAVVSRDCQACLLAAIISSAVMMAIKLILPPILVDIAHLFMVSSYFSVSNTTKMSCNYVLALFLTTCCLEFLKFEFLCFAVILHSKININLDSSLLLSFVMKSCDPLLNQILIQSDQMKTSVMEFPFALCLWWPKPQIFLAGWWS